MDVGLETDSFEPESHFLFWKPGDRPPVEPDGMAGLLNPVTTLVLNVHLQPSRTSRTGTALGRVCISAKGAGQVPDARKARE